MKIITDKKIKDLFALIDSLKNNEVDIASIKLYDLIGIYKSELYNSRNEILLRQKRYIYKIIFTLCGFYEIKVNKSNYEDFESYFNLTIDEINQKEINILSLLRNNDNIKLVKKAKSKH